MYTRPSAHMSSGPELQAVREPPDVVVGDRAAVFWKAIHDANHWATSPAPCALWFTGEREEKALWKRGELWQKAREGYVTAEGRCEEGDHRGGWRPTSGVSEDSQTPGKDQKENVPEYTDVK